MTYDITMTRKVFLEMKPGAELEFKVIDAITGDKVMGPLYMGADEESAWDSLRTKLPKLGLDIIAEIRHPN